MLLGLFLPAKPPTEKSQNQTQKPTLPDEPTAAEALTGQRESMNLKLGIFPTLFYM